jgi:hypothetical protein
MDTHDRLSASQAYLYRKIKGVSHQRANKVLKKAKLSDVQKEELTRAKQSLEESRIIVNLNLHESRIFGHKMIDSLSQSKRIYNLFEFTHAAMGNNPSAFRIRIMLEFKLYGGTTDIQPVLGGMSNTEHPNYGLLDYIDDPIGYSLVGSFGWYRFVLKKEVRDRSTFSPLDSLYIGHNQTFTWDDIDGVLATKVSDPARFWFEHINNKTVPIDQRGNVSYIETQILGGVLLNKGDVEFLYHPETDQFNRPFMTKLERLARECNFELKPY